MADEMLRIAKRNGRALTPLQLLKLVYISHGWSLAIRKLPLFNERIEAWKYGPVIPDLYHFTKHWGKEPIPLHLIDEDAVSVEPEISAFLEDVFAKYGRFSGYQLSQLTHQAGSPWDQAYSPQSFGIEIPNSTIKKHYEQKLEQSA